MANLANLIKNVNPPRQMTWAEYNALSTQIKYDGTEHYITDRDDAVQTAATTSALNKNGNSSNVQTELNSLNTSMNGILNGPTQIETAQYLASPHIRGIHTDAYGNIVHNNNYASAYWSISNNADNFRALSVYFQTGQINTGGRTFIYGKGNTFSSQIPCAGGLLSNSSKDISFSIPCYTSGQVSITDLSIVLRSVEGIYPYMKYGSNSIQLGSSAVVIWENSAQKYANSIDYITINAYPSFVTISIRFINPLVTSENGSTSIKTLTPVVLSVTPTIVVS